MGVSSLFRSADGYGLTIILGGAEVRLWDMCRIYSSLSNEGLIRPVRMFDGMEKENDSSRVCSPGIMAYPVFIKVNLTGLKNEKYGYLFSDQILVAGKPEPAMGRRMPGLLGEQAVDYRDLG